jgi:hypothetical protein
VGPVWFGGHSGDRLKRWGHFPLANGTTFGFGPSFLGTQFGDRSRYWLTDRLESRGLFP